MSNGVVLYRGPSVLDGSPIVVIATGLNASRNRKTGDMVQTWILREDVSPTAAAHTGDDASVCGDCPHRGTVENGKNVGRSCYVTLFQAPLTVWKAYKRGSYSDRWSHGTFHGLAVRLGAYGDPAAVPAWVWQSVLEEASSWTGYTHQWRTCSDQFKDWCMASCDSSSDYVLAKAKGWRTFRVRTANEPLKPREIKCPASAEAGNKTTCELCRACGGLGLKAKADISIIVHGSVGVVNNFNKRAA